MIPSYLGQDGGHRKEEMAKTSKDTNREDLIYCWEECKLTQPLWKPRFHFY